MDGYRNPVSPEESGVLCFAEQSLTGYTDLNLKRGEI